MLTKWKCWLIQRDGCRVGLRGIGKCIGRDRAPRCIGISSQIGKCIGMDRVPREPHKQEGFNPSSPSSLCGPPSCPPHRGPQQLSRNRAVSLAETGESRSYWLPLFTPLAVPLVAYYTELFSLRGRHKGLTEGFLSMAKGENELKILRFDVA